MPGILRSNQKWNSSQLLYNHLIDPFCSSVIAARTLRLISRLYTIGSTQIFRRFHLQKGIPRNRVFSYYSYYLRKKDLYKINLHVWLICNGKYSLQREIDCSWTHLSAFPYFQLHYGNRGMNLSWVSWLWFAINSPAQAPKPAVPAALVHEALSDFCFMTLPEFRNDSGLIRCDPSLLFGLSSQECLQLIEIHVSRCNRL